MSTYWAGLTSGRHRKTSEGAVPTPKKCSLQLSAAPSFNPPPNPLSFHQQLSFPFALTSQAQTLPFHPTATQLPSNTSPHLPPPPQPFQLPYKPFLPLSSHNPTLLPPVQHPPHLLPFFPFSPPSLPTTSSPTYITGHTSSPQATSSVSHSTSPTRLPEQSFDSIALRQSEAGTTPTEANRGWTSDFMCVG